MYNQLKRDRRSYRIIHKRLHNPPTAPRRCGVRCGENRGVFQNSPRAHHPVDTRSFHVVICIGQRKDIAVGESRHRGVFREESDGAEIHGLVRWRAPRSPVDGDEICAGGFDGLDEVAGLAEVFVDADLY